MHDKFEVLISEDNYGLRYSIALLCSRGDGYHYGTLGSDGEIIFQPIEEGRIIPPLIQMPRYVFDALRDSIENVPRTIEGKNSTIKAKDAHLQDLQKITDRLFKRFIDKE